MLLSFCNSFRSSLSRSDISKVFPSQVHISMGTQILHDLRHFVKYVRGSGKVVFQLISIP